MSGFAVGGRIGRIGNARVAGRPRCYNANIFPALKASTKIKLPCLAHEAVKRSHVTIPALPIAGLAKERPKLFIGAGTRSSIGGGNAGWAPSSRFRAADSVVAPADAAAPAPNRSESA